MQECPQCDKYLSPTAIACKCGWEKSQNAAHDRYRCVYIIKGIRCKMSGVTSPAAYGGPLYCREHWEMEKGDIKIATPEVAGHWLLKMRQDLGRAA